MAHQTILPTTRSTTPPKASSTHSPTRSLTRRPHGYGSWVRDGSLFDTSEATGGTSVTIALDMDFDWPYRDDNGPATVADWWDDTDCRVMRIAVGEDNQYLDAAVPDTSGDADPDNSVPAETSIYCGHFPGSTLLMGMDPITQEAQTRVETVGKALLARDDAGRPSFNEPADGTPTISGVAQVGSTLTADVADVGLTPTVSRPTTTVTRWSDYQWLRNGEAIPGAISSTYTLGPDDNEKTISVQVSFTDNARYYEMRVSNATSDDCRLSGRDLSHRSRDPKCDRLWR